MPQGKLIAFWITFALFVSVRYSYLSQPENSAQPIKQYVMKFLMISSISFSHRKSHYGIVIIIVIPISRLIANQYFAHHALFCIIFEI